MVAEARELTTAERPYLYPVLVQNVTSIEAGD
jgi:hypothetical protein